MSLAPVPQLIFSTRAARPRAGLEFNRELVACTPDLDQEARSCFQQRADLTYSTSRQPQLAPVSAFSRIDRRRWLFTRAVSLGRYRKSSHQMLVHGLVLEASHLEALAGNPFLLGRLDGIALADEHPGRDRRLPRLRLPAAAGSLAGEMNRQRLEQLRPVLESRYCDSFPALFELVRSTAGAVACLTPGQPDADMIEGLLLHFHPLDRCELSFHSWYAQDRHLDYRLLFATEAELPLLRKHFPGLAVWTPAAAGRPGEVAALTRALRETSAADLFATVERYRLTYFRDAPVPAIRDRDARLCLRHGLGRPLQAAERERCRRLALRSGNPLVACADDLAATWPRGHRQLAAQAASRLGRLGAVSQELAEDALAALVPSGTGPPADEDWLRRWALLVLWPLCGARISGREARARAWRRLVPRAHFEGLAQTVLTAGGDAAAALLDDYVVLDAEVLAGAETLPARPYWPRYLLWLAGAGRGLQAMVPRIEAVVAAMRDRRRAVAWLRRLETICHRAGLALVACRLVLQREIDLLEPEARPERVRQTLGALLADPAGASDKVLRTLLGQGRAAGDLWPAMAEWLLGQASPEASWPRWQRLIENQGQVLELETSGACARFLGRLARSPLADRIEPSCRVLLAARTPAVPEIQFLSRLLEPVVQRLTRAASRPPAPAVSPFLASAVAGSVGARVSCPQPSRGLDQALLDLLFLSLLHCRHLERLARSGEIEIEPDLDPGRRLAELRDAAETFLAYLSHQREGYLDDLLDSDLGRAQLPRLARRREWGHLLMDELIRSPPARGLDDPRFRSCLEIGLQQWRAETEPAGAGLIRVLRLVHMPPPGTLDPTRAGRMVRRLVPDGRAHYAHALIDARAQP